MRKRLAVFFLAAMSGAVTSCSNTLSRDIAGDVIRQYLQALKDSVVYSIGMTRDHDMYPFTAKLVCLNVLRDSGYITLMFPAQETMTEDGHVLRSSVMSLTSKGEAVPGLRREWGQPNLNNLANNLSQVSQRQALHTVYFPVLRRELAEVTGISQEAKSAKVTFTWQYVPTEVGATFKKAGELGICTDTSIQDTRGYSLPLHSESVMLRLWDNGWRIEENFQLHG